VQGVNKVIKGDKIMGTLAEKLPEEMARVRKVLGHYKEIGPAGMFGAAMIEQSLRKADKAVMSGDLVTMIAAYQDLQEIKD
jgi:hypothetical protein